MDMATEDEVFAALSSARCASDKSRVQELVHLIEQRFAAAVLNAPGLARRLATMGHDGPNELGGLILSARVDCQESLDAIGIDDDEIREIVDRYTTWEADDDMPVAIVGGGNVVPFGRG